MSIKDFISKHIVELEPQTQNAGANSIAIQSGGTIVYNNVASQSNTPAVIQENKEMIQTLEAVVLKRPSAFNSIIESSEKLKAIIPDETTRIKAAVISLPAESQSKTAIKAAIDLHIHDLDQNSNLFFNMLSIKIKDVESLINESNSIAASISSNRDKIVEIQKTIEVLETTKNTKQLDAKQLENSLNESKVSFENSLLTVKNNLLAKLSLFNSIIS